MHRSRRYYAMFPARFAIRAVRTKKRLRRSRRRCRRSKKPNGRTGKERPEVRPGAARATAAKASKEAERRRVRGPGNHRARLVRKAEQAPAVKLAPKTNRNSAGSGASFLRGRAMG